MLVLVNIVCLPLQVIVGTIISYYAMLHVKYGVIPIGDIPNGYVFRVISLMYVYRVVSLMYVYRVVSLMYVYRVVSLMYVYRLVSLMYVYRVVSGIPNVCV